MLLGRSPDRDWSIVRLIDTPPAGVQFAAWRAEAVPVGTAVATIHHPEGDLKKFSTGTATNDFLIDDDFVYGNFTEVVWNSGVTEPGSSGGPLLTLATGGAFYEIRGGLYAGASDCKVPKGPDYYSEFQSALPAIRTSIRRARRNVRPPRRRIRSIGSTRVLMCSMYSCRIPRPAHARRARDPSTGFSARRRPIIGIRPKSSCATSWPLHPAIRRK